jgi:hypothetical protein
MCRLIGALAIAVVLAPSPGPAPAEDRPARSIFIRTGTGWVLDIHSDGSGRLQFGAGAEDGWRFPAGTIDVGRATKDLRAPAGDDEVPLGSLGSLVAYVYSFESERRAPDKPGKARYTRDGNVIPGLLKAPAAAAESRSRSHARRKAEILNMWPLPGKPSRAEPVVAPDPRRR